MTVLLSYWLGCRKVNTWKSRWKWLPFPSAAKICRLFLSVDSSSNRFNTGSGYTYIFCRCSQASWWICFSWALCLTTALSLLPLEGPAAPTTEGHKCLPFPWTMTRIQCRNSWLRSLTMCLMHCDFFQASCLVRHRQIQHILICWVNCKN